MPDPSWVASDGGSPHVNGPYTWVQIYLSRDAFRLLPSGPYLWWSRTGNKYYISDALGATHPYSLYMTGIYVYDLPGNPWYKAGLGDDPPPTLAAWEPPPPPVRPQATNPLTEGRIDPVSLLDPTPLFSWSYTPGDGGSQSAYQVQVSSSAALRFAHTPDVWDTGIVASAQAEVVYAGAPLADLEMYFCAIRVRDQDNVWSEDW